jgi:hypothetical protein
MRFFHFLIQIQNLNLDRFGTDRNQSGPARPVPTGSEPIPTTVRLTLLIAGPRDESHGEDHPHLHPKLQFSKTQLLCMCWRNTSLSTTSACDSGTWSSADDHLSTQKFGISAHPTTIVPP